MFYLFMVQKKKYWKYHILLPNSLTTSARWQSKCLFKCAIYGHSQHHRAQSLCPTHMIYIYIIDPRAIQLPKREQFHKYSSASIYVTTYASACMRLSFPFHRAHCTQRASENRDSFSSSVARAHSHTIYAFKFKLIYVCWFNSMGIHLRRALQTTSLARCVCVNSRVRAASRTHKFCAHAARTRCSIAPYVASYIRI